MGKIIFNLKYSICTLLVFVLVLFIFISNIKSLDKEDQLAHILSSKISSLCLKGNDFYSDFTLRKIKKDFLLPNDYIPSSLENISKKVKTSSIACLRSDVVSFLSEMFIDAKKDDISFMVTSGFRQTEIQQYLYDLFTHINGYEPDNTIALPRASEHQLGTTVDLTDDSVGYISANIKFAKGNGFLWLQKNAFKYGFSMSFAKGKEKITGFKYEPWHWRFLGIKMATFLFENNLVFNELEFDKDGFPTININ